MELIVNFPPTLRRTRRLLPVQRAVSFSKQVDVSFVEDLSRWYKADLWFSCREMESFRSRRVLLVAAIVSNGMTMAQYAKRNVDNTSAFLGLEGHFSRAASGMMARRRRAVVAAVLSEHRRQCAAGVFTPEDLRRVLETISRKSFERARVIAKLHVAGGDWR